MTCNEKAQGVGYGYGGFRDSVGMGIETISKLLAK